jgi:hypothetical protein
VLYSDIAGSQFLLPAPPGDFPFSGAVVDMDFARNQYFGTDLSALTPTNTTARKAMTSAGLWTEFAANTLSRTDLGLYIRNRTTQLARFNRDCSNAVWTLTDMTSSATGSITGADGTIGGSRLTATAANGQITQLISDAIIQGPQGAFCIKRVSGTGTITITTNNFTAGTATWDVTSIVDNPTTSSGWTFPNIASGGASPYTIGIRLGTSGDVIDVDYFHTEAQNALVVVSFPPVETLGTPVDQDHDNVTVSPASLLYTSLTPTSTFSVYVEYFHAGGDNLPILNWAGGNRLYAHSGGSPRGARTFRFQGTVELNTNIGDQAQSNAIWPTVGSANALHLQEIFSSPSVIAKALYTRDNATGIATVQATNNFTGPGTIVSGVSAFTNATGTLYLGTNAVTTPFSNIQAICGFVRRLTVFPTVLATYPV